MVNVCKIGAPEMNGRRPKKRMSSSKRYDGLRPVQIFPSHSMPFLLNTFLDPSTLEKGRQSFLNQWSSTWWARLYRPKVKMLLSVQCSVIGMTLKKADTAHSDAGREICAAWLVGNGSIVGYHYGSFVYRGQNCNGSGFKRYRQSIVKSVRETFLRCRN